MAIPLFASGDIPWPNQPAAPPAARRTEAATAERQLLRQALAGGLRFASIKRRRLSSGGTGSWPMGAKVARNISRSANESLDTSRDIWMLLQIGFDLSMAPRVEQLVDIGVQIVLGRSDGWQSFDPPQIWVGVDRTLGLPLANQTAGASPAPRA